MAQVPSLVAQRSCPSHRLFAHLNVSHFQALPFFVVHRRPTSNEKSYSLELVTPFSTSKVRAPFFSPCLRQGVEEAFRLALLKVPSAGFGYPLEVFYAISHSRKRFQLPALIGLSLQSLTPLDKSKIGFPTFYPFLHFLRKLHEPSTGASTVSSSPRSRPLLFAPRGFSSGQRHCSLESSNLSGFPTWFSRQKAFIPFLPPLFLVSSAISRETTSHRA